MTREVQAVSGDLVLVFFAGHGSQTWSDDPDEPTGLDQTICPTDVRNGDPSMDVRGKELGGYLRAFYVRNQPTRHGMIRPLPGQAAPFAPRNAIAVLDDRPAFTWFDAGLFHDAERALRQFADAGAGGRIFELLRGTVHDAIGDLDAAAAAFAAADREPLD